MYVYQKPKQNPWTRLFTKISHTYGLYREVKYYFLKSCVKNALNQLKNMSIFVYCTVSVSIKKFKKGINYFKFI